MGAPPYNVAHDVHIYLTQAVFGSFSDFQTYRMHIFVWRCVLNIQENV